MNEAAKQYWEAFWALQTTQSNIGGKPKVNAFQFGDDPDGLAKKVIDGVKTATCSAHLFYELENEPLPVVDQYDVILNQRDEPVAIIRNIDVQVLPFNEVSVAFAVAEGEGTYEDWCAIHIAFFTEELAKIGQDFSEEMLLVCEKFELVDVRQG